MKRLAAFFVVVAACGAPPASPIVVSAPLAAPARRLEVLPPSAPAAAAAAPFEIVMARSSLCVIAAGKAYCPRELSPTVPLAAGPALDGLTTVTALSFGSESHCAATADGKVACGGDNHFGQLGAGLAALTAETTVIPSLQHVKRVVSGPFTSCAITDDGELWCWGKNESGESGSATNVLRDARAAVEPEHVSGIQGVTEVAITWASTCATTTKGEVACWGATDLPEHRTRRGVQDERPTVLPSLAGATSLTANEHTFCAVRNAKVVCWGRRSSLLSRTGSPPLTELAIPDAQGVSLGHRHGCAIGRGGDVYCFGAAYLGALGVPDDPRDYQPHGPTKVAGLPPVEKVACGASLSCALTASHALYCWGRFGDEGRGVGSTSTPAQMRVLADR